MRAIDLTGKVYGKLTVLRHLGRRKSKSGKSSAMFVECRCECGRVAEFRSGSLQEGDTTTCGCSKGYALGIPSSIQHGLSRTPEYTAWIRMRRACYDKGNASYDDYGGRGIAVCDRWLNSFENFLADMGPRPSAEHSVDRMKNDLGYSPDNCRWATRSEQARNRRSSKMLEYNGETKTMADWAESFDIPYRLMKTRVRHGWPMEKIATQPARQRKVIKAPHDSCTQ